MKRKVNKVKQRGWKVRLEAGAGKEGDEQSKAKGVESYPYWRQAQVKRKMNRIE